MNTMKLPFFFSSLFISGLTLTISLILWQTPLLRNVSDERRLYKSSYLQLHRSSLKQVLHSVFPNCTYLRTKIAMLHTLSAYHSCLCPASSLLHSPRFGDRLSERQKYDPNRTLLRASPKPEFSLTRTGR